MAKAIYEAAGMRLAAELAELRPEDFPQYLTRNADDLIRSGRPFADYMRMKFKEKGILQQDIFLTADLPERHGYKLISEQKHTPPATRSCGFVWPRNLISVKPRKC